MVADNVVYHPTVGHYLRFIATTMGRDKVLRTIQYFARFYSWYLLRTNYATKVITPWTQTKKQLGIIRRAMRIGKNVEHLKAAAVAADAKNMDPILKFCAIGRQLGYATYLTLDSCIFLDSAGIRPLSTAKKLQRGAYRAWMTGLTFNIVAGVYTLRQLQLKEEAIDKKDGEGVVEAKKLQMERSATNLQLVSDLADWLIPISQLGLINFDEGVVGLAGTTSSLIGVLAAWKKTA